MSRPPALSKPDPQALLSTAIRLARSGLPVFPCEPDGKRPLTTQGFRDATTDEAQIRSWWHQHPTANLAVPTGEQTFDVLDVDVRASGSGYPAFRKLLREGLLEGRSHLVVTPSGGLHVYFNGSRQNSSRLTGDYLDFKAQGGCVLVPPSVVGGRPYELLYRANRSHRPLNWQAVREVLRPQDARARGVSMVRQAQRGIDSMAAWVARLPEEQRNAGTFWAACQVIEQGAHDLRPIVEAAVRAGLPRREAARTVASALDRSRRHLPPVPGRSSAPRPNILVRRQFRRR